MQDRKDGGPLLLYLVISSHLFWWKAFVLCLALCYKLWPTLKKKKKGLLTF